MPRVFISYKRADKDKVFPLKDKIEAAIGEPCWIDLEGIGCELKEWEDVVIEAINECSIFIFMYSQTLAEVVDFEDDRTLDEFAYARSRKKRIVFVNIDASPLTDRFQFRFGARQQIDGTSEESINSLINNLKKWLSNTTCSNIVHVRDITSKAQLNNLINEFTANNGFVSINKEDLEYLFQANKTSYMIIPLSKKRNLKDVFCQIKASINSCSHSISKLFLYIKVAEGERPIFVYEMRTMYEFSKYCERFNCEMQWGIIEGGIRDEIFVILAS